jgi:4-amino-4-deoxy-L-arabinose transferase-like glycosyltransferase
MNLSLKYLQNHQYFREICIGLLLTVAFLVRCIFYSGGVTDGDAFAYARHAYDIASGEYDVNTIRTFYGFRYFVLIPTAFSFLCFGVNDVAASIFPLLASLLNVFVVYLIAEKSFNRTIAVISAILLIFYPLDVIRASILSPDSFIPLLASSAILFYLMAEEESLPTPQRNILLVLSGIVIAFAYMSRVTSIFLFFSLAIFQIYHKKYRHVVWTAIGLFIPLVTEALYFYLSTGDPFFEFHRITNPAISYAILKDHGTSLLVYPIIMLGADLTGLAYFGLTWWLVVGGLALSWFKKDNKMLLIAVCLIIPFFGFEFGFQSLKHGILIIKDYPYLTLLTGPAMIIGAYFLYHTKDLLQVQTKSPFLLFCILTLILMNLYGTYRLNLNNKNDTAPFRVVSDYLKKKPAHIIYSHHFRWPLSLGYFLQYDSSFTFRDLNTASTTDIKEASDAYVILHKRYLETDVRDRPIPQDTFAVRFSKSPPQGWMKVLSFSGKPTYNSVDLYYVQKRIH